MAALTKSLPFEMREHAYHTGSGAVTVPFLVCLPLEEAGFVNAFSTRLGGVSPFPKEALHLSYKNDSLENVRENRRRFLKAAGFSGFTIMTADQTHSSNSSVITRDSLAEIKLNIQHEYPGDALISNLSMVLVGTKTADCVPILIGDPETGVFAAIHAGWKGTLDQITEKTIARLVRDFHVEPENCLAAMGPAACGGCYEVGPDVSEPFKKNFPYADDLFSPATGSSKSFLDVRLANAMQLLSAGLSPMNIFGADECTMHENNLFFSHRLEGKNSEGPTGRMLSVIGRSSS